MMTPESFQAAREDMGLSRRQLSDLLGYQLRDAKRAYDEIKKMESGRRPISPMCERLLTMIYRHFKSTGHLPEFEA